MKKWFRNMCALAMALVLLWSAAGSISAYARSLNSSVLAQTDKGVVRGYQENGLDIYKGIPYAAPPVGNLRWRSPQPAKAWSGVKDCTRFSASAMQDTQKAEEPYTKEFVIDDSTGYSEDCLYLNVWSKHDEKKNKPVIVYVHGGAFVSGGSSCEVYKGDGLAEKGAVFVNLNYRLGLFGFYAHPELSKESSDGTSGSYALQDILMALEWVKKNISAFGGNPNNITLVGQSAGACLTELLAVSPKTKGLINKAVVLSYPQYGSQYTTLDNMEKVGKLAAGDTSLQDLRKLPAKDAMEKLGTFWVPCEDGVIVTESTKDAYLKGKANDIPMIFSSVPGDIMFSLGGVTSKDPKEKVMALSVVPGLLDKPNTITTQERNTLMTNYLCSAAARKKTMRSKTYVVFFSHVMPGPKAEDNGAFHTSDVPYWLDNLVSSRNGYWTAEDITLADRMSDYILQFARTGDPNGNTTARWYPYNGTFTFLSIEGADKTGMANIENQRFWQRTVQERIGG